MSILEISAAAYHADQVADQLTLSKSIAHTLLSASPRHAWTNHPRLNPNFERKADDRFELGTAAHALFLEGDAGVQVCDYDSWRTAAAKEDAALARSHGKIPMLPGQWADCEAMVAALKEQLATLTIDPPLFADGTAEKTIVWEEAGVLCRARLDWLRNDLTAIDDLKSTGRSAKGAVWTKRALYDQGADLQAAMYLRGLKAVTGVDAKWRWVVIETSPPYALSVITPGSDVLALADAKFDRALTVWKRCLETNVWPSYSTDLFEAELPAWSESEWLADEAREDVAA